MSGWQLPRANDSEYAFSKSDWRKTGFTNLEINDTPGGLMLHRNYPGSDLNLGYLNRRFYVHNLMPAWFALTPDFNTDISTWNTEYNTDNKITAYVRDYTFAWSKAFNQQIDWFYPPSQFIDLGYISPDSRDLVEGSPGNSNTDWTSGYNSGNPPPQKTALQQFINPWKKDFNTIAFGSIQNIHKWWNTFTGSPYNNGGSAIPIIMGDHMLSTFRDSEVDNNITIQKPGHGQGYYSRLFEGTTSWSSNKTMDWLIQNRKDNPDLVNIYYHTIFTDYMFKDSSFNGNLGAGWRYFFFNVTNLYGYSPMVKGISDQYSNFESKQQLDQISGAPASEFTQLGYSITRHDPTGVMRNAGIRNPVRGWQYWAGYQTQTNNFLSSTTFPMVKQQVFRCGHIKTDTIAAFYRYPYNPVETNNFAGMFENATAFNQNLSGYHTRWCSVRGAFTLPGQDYLDFNQYAYRWQQPFNRAEAGFDNLNANEFNNYGKQYYTYNYTSPDRSEMDYSRSFTLSTGEFREMTVMVNPKNFSAGNTGLDANKYPQMLFKLATSQDNCQWTTYMDRLSELDSYNNQYNLTSLITHGYTGDIENWPNTSVDWPNDI